MFNFIKTFDFNKNMVPLMVLALLAFVVVFSVPIISYFKRKNDGPETLFKGINSKKILNIAEISCLLCFLFIMQ
jgi:hypothetical protein